MFLLNFMLCVLRSFQVPCIFSEKKLCQWKYNGALVKEECQLNRNNYAKTS